MRSRAGRQARSDRQEPRAVWPGSGLGKDCADTERKATQLRKAAEIREQVFWRSGVVLDEGIWRYHLPSGHTTQYPAVTFYEESQRVCHGDLAMTS